MTVGTTRRRVKGLTGNRPERRQNRPRTLLGGSLEGYRFKPAGAPASRSCLDIRKEIRRAAKNQGKRDRFSPSALLQDREARALVASAERARGEHARARRILDCGPIAAASYDGELLTDETGRPVLLRRSCNHKLCEPCEHRRSMQAAAHIERIAAAAFSQHPEEWDGRWRMMTLTRQAEKKRTLCSAADELFRLWYIFRERWPDLLKTCLLSFEIVWNEKAGWWHPHLHVLVFSSGKLPRDVLLRSWQEINGYRVDGGRGKGSKGGCNIKERRSPKEALKYAVKGVAKTLAELPEERRIELLSYIENLKVIRTYGALRSVYPEVEEDPDWIDSVAFTGDGRVVLIRPCEGVDAPIASWRFGACAVRQAYALLHLDEKAEHDASGLRIRLLRAHRSTDRRLLRREKERRVRLLRRYRWRRWPLARPAPLLPLPAEATAYLFTPNVSLRGCPCPFLLEGWRYRLKPRRWLDIVLSQLSGSDGQRELAVASREVRALERGRDEYKSWVAGVWRETSAPDPGGRTDP